MTTLLPKTQSILDRPFMQFRPFGVTPDGEKIRDVSGMTVKANIEYLEEEVGRGKGEDAGRVAIERLCDSLNARIPDPAYHVTPKFLRTPWNSYSYEFVCYLGEFCIQISEDPNFQFEMGKHKLISPTVQILGRPFSVSQIFKMFPHFGEKFAKGSIHFSTQSVTNSSAVLRMKFTDHVYRQFGPYRNRCAEIICQTAKAGIMAVPQHVHQLGYASVRNRQCIADGDEYCEWEFHWQAQPLAEHLTWPLLGTFVSSLAFVYVRWSHPELSWLEASVWALIAGAAAWFGGQWSRLKKRAEKREHMIHEQRESLNTSHEELREAYLDQERTNVELRHKVNHLTTLRETGLLFSSVLDREALLDKVLHTIMDELRYERVMIAFFDRDRRVSHDARLLGAPLDVVHYARALETPVTDPASLEGEVLLQGRAVLIGDIQQEWDRLHPLTQQLAERTQVKSFIAVPLKARGTVIGSLTVNRTQEHALTHDDLHVMVTVASQISIALDNADAYHRIEAQNVDLERQVEERTRSLHDANKKLEELNQRKSISVSNASHELRTPLTVMKGFVENMLDGLTGTLHEQQRFYLTRIKHNVERLTRTLIDLLDLSRIEAGRMELRPEDVSLPELTAEVIHDLRPQAEAKSLTLHTTAAPQLAPVWGDRDKIIQILTNLIHNAVKFTPPSGTISIAFTPLEDHTIQVCVADTGCGIAPEEVPRVFDDFYRSDNEPAETRGAGLGLAITKSLVELHQGRIWVESTVGSGSRFYVTLPTRRIGT